MGIRGGVEINKRQCPVPKTLPANKYEMGRRMPGAGNSPVANRPGFDGKGSKVPANGDRKEVIG